MDDLWITADGWSTFFALQAVIALHIGGSKQDQWIFEYIPRGSLVPQRKFVNGKDMYDLVSSIWRLGTIADAHLQYPCCRLDGLEASVETLWAHGNCGDYLSSNKRLDRALEGLLKNRQVPVL